MALIPHLLGFYPYDSMVVLAGNRDGGAILIRVDQPLDIFQRADAARTVALTLRSEAGSVPSGDVAFDDGPAAPAATSHQEPDGEPAGELRPQDAVTVLCFTGHRYDAETSIADLEHNLARAEIPVGPRIWVHRDRWVDLASDLSGPCRPETVSRLAALGRASGLRPPASSRESLLQRFESDPDLVAQVKPTLRARQKLPRAGVDERAWLIGITSSDPPAQRLGNEDAARALLAVQDHSGQYAVMLRIGPETADTQRGLWTDLSRRAPDELRGPVAALAAFACWQAGDGAAAWCALEQVPAAARHEMLPRMMRSTLTHGIHPRMWGESLARPAHEESIDGQANDPATSKAGSRGRSTSTTRLVPPSSGHSRPLGPGDSPAR